MKKRALTLMLMAGLLLSLLCGCGASSADTAAAVSTSTNAASDSGYGYSYDMEVAEVESAASGQLLPETELDSGFAVSRNSGNAALQDAKLIYSADIGLETTAFDSTVSQLTELVTRLGGYFEYSNIDNYGRYRSGYYTVRVPAEAFDELCLQAGELCQLNYINRSAEDISESYYDTESRLETQKTKLSRLQELLSRAESMEDIITIESEISETELNIERLTGTLRSYDSLVSYSTVSISLSEVYKLSDIEEPAIGFGAKLLSALKQGCVSFVSGLEELALAIAYGWIGWLIFIIILIVVIRVAVKKIRRIQKERSGNRVNSEKGEKNVPDKKDE